MRHFAGKRVGERKNTVTRRKEKKKGRTTTTGRGGRLTWYIGPDHPVFAFHSHEKLKCGRVTFGKEVYRREVTSMKPSRGGGGKGSGGISRGGRRCVEGGGG